MNRSACSPVFHRCPVRPTRDRHGCNAGFSPARTAGILRPIRVTKFGASFNSGSELLLHLPARPQMDRGNDTRLVAAGFSLTPSPPPPPPPPPATPPPAPTPPA